MTRPIIFWLWPREDCKLVTDWIAIDATTTARFGEVTREQLECRIQVFYQFVAAPHTMQVTPGEYWEGKFPCVLPKSFDPDFGRDDLDLKYKKDLMELVCKTPAQQPLSFCLPLKYVPPRDPSDMFGRLNIFSRFVLSLRTPRA